MQDDRNFNGGMRDENGWQYRNMLFFCRWGREQDVYRWDHNLAQVNKSHDLRDIKKYLDAL